MVRQGLGDAAALMVVGRVLNMALNILMVPLLIHFLGGHGFALWALLLSCAAVFAALEIGIPTAFVKHLAVALGSPQAGRASPFPGAASSLLLALYGALLPVVVLASPRLAAWFQLPDEALLRFPPPHRLHLPGRRAPIGSSDRVVLPLRRTPVLHRSGSLLLAGLPLELRRYDRRLDLAPGGRHALCFWSAQLLVCTVGWIVAKRRLGWRVARDPGRRRAWGTLAAYGVKVQIQDWAQVVNFQFDKFVMLGAVGLWGVALYEVANRTRWPFGASRLPGWRRFCQPRPWASRKARTPGIGIRRRRSWPDTARCSSSSHLSPSPPCSFTPGWGRWDT